MVKAPLFQWNGPFPYDVLAKVGITPGSTMKQINDAGFDLMSKGMEIEDRAAWDELRLVRKRFVVDFFLYQTDQTDWAATDEIAQQT